jgi:hypothetical protein
MSFAHQGPWDAHSRQSRVLRFIEKYVLKVDSLDLASTPSTTFYSPLAILHDNKGDAHLGGSAIWQGIQRLFAPFSRTFHEVVEIRVVPGADGREVVYGEFLTHFWLKGDSEDIVAPRFFVWTIGEAVDYAGTEGLQFVEARLFWDTGILGRYVTDKNKKEREKRGCNKPMLMIQ